MWNNEIMLKQMIRNRFSIVDKPKQRRIARNPVVFIVVCSLSAPKCTQLMKKIKCDLFLTGILTIAFDFLRILLFCDHLSLFGCKRVFVFLSMCVRCCVSLVQTQTISRLLIFKNN